MSERLTNTEMHAPEALLQLAVHPEIGDWIELESEIHAEGADRCHVAKAGTVIGQGHAKKVLSVAVHNHYKRLNHQTKHNDVELAKSTAPPRTTIETIAPKPG